MIKTFLLLISLCFVHGMNRFGYTSPDLFVYENDTIEIECGLPDKVQGGYTSSDLVFNETCNNSPWVSYDKTSQYLKILTDRRIRLRLPNRRYGICNFTCQLPTYNIYSTHVVVGKRLGKVKQFKCRSLDWKNMTCYFVEMDNFLRITYNLSYQMDTETSGSISCPLTPDYRRTRSCIIYNTTSRDNHEYFSLTKQFIFTLKSTINTTNESDVNVQKFYINHMGVIVPSALENIEIQNINTDNAIVTWKISKHYYYSKVRFDYLIEIMSQFDSEWHRIQYFNVSSQMEQAILENLKYPFANYEIRIRYKTTEAAEDMWSEYVTRTFQTKSKSPDRSPESVFGAFYINDHGKVTFYWQGLASQELNGPNFYYSLNSSDGTSKLTTENSIDFEELDLENSSHTFNIYSTNLNGSSLKPLQIHIPKKSDLLNAKIDVVKSRNEKGYNVTWVVNGIDQHLVDYFTVFWCKSVSDLFNTCTGKFNILSLNETSYFVDEKDAMNFAVAGQSKSGRTTGMQWNKCTSNHPDQIGKPIFVLIPNDGVDSRELTIKWFVDCRDTSIVKAFNITYCKRAEVLGNDTDDGGIQNKDCLVKILDDPKVSQYTLTGLKPYTMYNVMLSLISQTKKGKEVLTYERTRETAPSPVRDVKVIQVTNTSVDISWLPPEELNGIINHYSIHYFWNDTKPHWDHRDSIGKNPNFTLDGLTSFTTYSILVRAHTVEYSNNSNSVYVKTLPGTPTKMGPIKYGAMVSWEPPEHKGGRYTYYELRVTSINQEKTTIETKSIKMKQTILECKFLDALCKHENEDHFISIRAVNVLGLERHFNESWDEFFNTNSSWSLFCETDERLETLYALNPDFLPGDWSEPHSTNCYIYSYAYTLIYAALSIVIIILFIIGVVKLWKSLYECWNFHADLPEAIKAVIKSEGGPRLNNKRNSIQRNSMKNTQKEPLIGSIKESNMKKPIEHHRKHKIIHSIIDDHIQYIEPDTPLIQTQMRNGPSAQERSMFIDDVNYVQNQKSSGYIPMSSLKQSVPLGPSMMRHLLPPGPSVLGQNVPSVLKQSDPLAPSALTQTVPSVLKQSEPLAPSVLRQSVPPSTTAATPGYMLLTRGITANNYVGDTLQIPSNRSSLKQQLQDVERSNRQSKPFPEPFQIQPIVNSGYVQPSTNSNNS